MVEGSFGDLQIVENVLNRKALIAHGQDQPLRGIENLIASRGVLCNVDRPSHEYLVIRPTVGLFIECGLLAA